jgi:phospholipid/cholesterol/gamma-HCH transport system substrate-binding protein
VRWLSRIVTFVVTIGVVAGFVVLIRANLPKTKVGQGFHTYATFRDASRLAIGSPVMIAGVHVGEITGLTIVGPNARVDLALRDNIDIPADSWITKRAESAFGDSYVEISPSAEEGAATAAKLESGQPLLHVEEGSSTDKVLRSIGRAMPKVDTALESIHTFLGNGRRWVNGPLINGIAGADVWIAAGNIESPLARADHAMERFDQATTSAAEAVAGAGPTVKNGLDRVDRAIASARKQIASVREGLTSGLGDFRDGLDRVDKPIADYGEVVSALNEGSGDDWRGTLGRQINSPELADTLEDLSETAASAANGLNRLKSFLGVRVEYNVFSKIPRIYVTAEIYSRHDKYFLVELEKSGIGGLPAEQLADLPASGSVTRSQEIQDQLRFTAQFGKRLGPIGFRGGIKDSTLGVGTDVLLDSGRLHLSADLFGSFTTTPDLKLAAALQVFHFVYVVAGIDDVLNKPGYLPIDLGNTSVPNQFETLRYGRDYFLGATLRFDDADLSMLIRVYGALIAGLAI